MTADQPAQQPLATPRAPRRNIAPHMAIRHWPMAERPRERLLARGSEALSDAELLAIFLRTGGRGQSAIDLARDLIRHFGSLKNLMNASPSQLRARHGIKAARAATLLAVSELSRRILMERAQEGTLLNSPTAVRSFLTDHIGLLIGGKLHEVFVCAYLDARHKLLACEESAQGTLTRVAVYPREIVRRAIELNAAGLIVAHNHPSGGAEPSASDHKLTRTLRDALALIDVKLLGPLHHRRERDSIVCSRGLVMKHGRREIRPKSLDNAGFFLLESSFAFSTHLF